MHYIRTILLSVFAAGSTSVQIEAFTQSTCQATWMPTFGGAVLDGNGRVMQVFDDGTGPAIYLGGDFRGVGSQLLRGVAKWTGSGWSPLGGGLGSAPGAVVDLTVYNDGSGAALFAAGNGSIFPGPVAKWNGTAWVALGTGLSISNPSYPGEVAFMGSIASGDFGSGNRLYAAGFFDTAGGAPAQGFASWNGSSWLPVAPPASGISDMVVFDAGAGPELHCSGNGVARLGPAGWTDMSNGATYVSQLAVADIGAGSQLYGIGRFGTPSFDPYDVARWDGSAWVRLNCGFNVVSALASYDDGTGPKLYAQGRLGPGNLSSRFATFDGVTWTYLPGEVRFSNGPGGVAALLQHNDGTGNALYATGGFTQLAGNNVSQFAKFDGATWSGDGGGVGDQVLALETFDDGGGEALYVGGYFVTIDGDPTYKGVATWDGTDWSALGSGISNGSVHALEVFDAGNGDELYVGGAFSAAAGNPGDRIARWNGSSWSPLGSGVQNGTGQSLVRAIAVFNDGSGDALYVGGTFPSAGGVPSPNLARWDGVSWSAVGGGVTGGPIPSVFSLHVFDDGSGPALYVGGRFQSAGAVTANGIAKWNGSSWTALGSGLVTFTGAAGAAFALEDFDDGNGPALYIGGNFSTVAGVSAGSVARWRSGAWSALDGSFSNLVLGLRAFDDGGGVALFAAGQSLPGGSMVARFNGAWSVIAPTNPTLVSEGSVLATFDDGTGESLYIGGRFADIPSRDVNLARYGCTPPQSYCAGVANSTGNAAALTVQGSTIVASNNVQLACSNLPAHVFTLLLTSRTQGFVLNPGGSQGNLCLGGAIGRFVGPGQLLNAGAAGMVILPIDLSRLPEPMAFAVVQPGQTWNFQCWYRDSVGGVATSNLSNGVSALFR